MEAWLRPDSGRSHLSPSIRFTLDRRPRVLPDSPPARVIGPLSVWRTGDVLAVAADGTTGGEVDLATGEGVVWSAAGRRGTWRAVHQCLRALWLVALGRHGLHAVHGAAVEVEGRALLVLGPSGSGKSTLAWHLASNGAGYLADDVMLLTRDPPRVAGFADRSRLRVDSPYRPAGGALLPDGKIGIAAGRTCREQLAPGAALLLEDRPGTRAEVRAPGDVMAYLLRSGFLTLDPSSDRSLMAAMSGIATAGPAVGVPRHLPLPDLDTVRTWTRTGR